MLLWTIIRGIFLIVFLIMVPNLASDAAREVVAAPNAVSWPTSWLAQLGNKPLWVQLLWAAGIWYAIILIIEGIIGITKKRRS